MIEVEIREGLLFSLEDELQRAVTRAGSASVLLHIESIIKRRTLQGRYLDGSSPDPGRYRSSAHKKRRQNAGRQTDRVDLFESGEMLDAIKSRSRYDNGRLVIEVGYLDGVSDADKSRIAGYHDRTGAGPGKVIRRFVGLASDEEQRVVDALRRAVERRN